jgi:hypothetical protein
MGSSRYGKQIAAIEASVARLAADIAEDQEAPVGVTFVIANIMQLLAAMRVALGLLNGVDDATSPAD